MKELTTYSFLPWLRNGIANSISGVSGPRATVAVTLDVEGSTLDGNSVHRQVQRDVQIYGPGDVVGLDKKNIIRTEPLHWVTNFEPNYLAFVDFYDEDLPWRYSPDRPRGHRLQPWLALVILREDEFEDAPLRPGQPLPAIRLLASDPLQILPAADELWAWAHVQLNRSVIGDEHRSENGTAVGQAAQQLLEEDPDLGFSRVVCPRRPEPGTAYYAFLVPTFESGRLAGLGEPLPVDLPAEAPAWAEGSVPPTLPYYHRYYFRTGGAGDFEYLVRLLEPRPVAAVVGRRPIDVQAPGANLPGITDPELEGVLLLEGALRVPDASLAPEERARVEAYRNWDGDATSYPHPFQEKLAAFINLRDDYHEEPAADANADAAIDAAPPDNDVYSISENPDPVITAPLYGRWHALTQRLLRERDGNPVPNDRNWVHQLNLDPRHRTAAGFGTRIVQENQEDYMRAAWQQVGEILEANRRIRLAQLAREAGLRYYVRYLRPAAAPRDRSETAALNQHVLQLTAPLHSRVLTEEATVRHSLSTSTVPPAALSPQFRRALRPRGPLARRLDQMDGRAVEGDLLERMAQGEVSAAPPREVPSGLPTVEDVREEAGPAAVDPRSDLDEWLRRFPWLRFLPRVLLLVLLLLLRLLLWLTGLWRFFPPAAPGPLDAEARTPEAVDDLPRSPDFRISEPGDDFAPTTGATDSAEARDYKQAMRDYYAAWQRSLELGTEPPKHTPDLTRLRTEVVAQVDPMLRVSERTLAGLRIPELVEEGLATERFVPVMAYPKIDRPMYEPLVDHNTDWFLPNVDRIPQNTITLLETNQAFIEAYMVGLNHEMGRELLWREYFTDQRGSYFRQFWESEDLLNEEDQTEEERREAAYDIPPLHRWSRRSQLGEHDLRELRRRAESLGTAERQEAVLVVRGELLKKYPNAVIYAQSAKWQTKTVDGREVPDNKKPRLLVDEGDLPPDTPKKEYMRTPLYEAQIQPDIYFFGFDLTVEEARGELGDDPGDDPGWFFVIKERPGEPRLGLDLGDVNADVEVWNDLSWQRVGVAEGEVLRINDSTPSIPLDELEGNEDVVKATQRAEDVAVPWTSDMSAADLAYILYQVPVLVAVHAADMIAAPPES